MTRFSLLLGVVLAAVIIGSADAGRPGRWDVVASGANAPAVSQELGVVRTADGTLHVAWREGFSDIRARSITSAGGLGGVSTVVSGWSLGADPTLVTSPGGVRAFFAAVTPIEGIVIAEARGGSSTWSAGALLDEREFARGRTPGAALLPDGTPILTWYSVGDIVARGGLAFGAPLHALTAGGTNTRPNVAVDASGSALVAWCEFTGAVRGVFVRRVDATGAPAGAVVKLPGSTTDSAGAPQASCVLESTVSRREPIAARTGGGVYVVGTSGYPALNRVLIWRLDGNGSVVSTIVAASGANVSYSEPAVAAAPDGRIWAAWLEPAGAGKRIVARRSNRAGTVFGAPVRAVAPGGISVGTVNLSAQTDRVDVLGIVQSLSGAGSVQHAQLLPGLTIVRGSLVRRGRGVAAVTFRVLDAGEPVVGARVTAAGRSGITRANGTVTLEVRRGGTVTATKVGYVGASTRFSCCR